ncbi:MAG: hypothetical protein EXR76_19135 [Myxococcales bacterium]|nr:hypothetical protein [Myxococcales bacterium]
MSRLLLLLMVFASGCSIAKDFDRSFLVENSTFPKQLLEAKAPNEGYASVADSKCGEFCDAFIGCVANDDVCHLYYVETTGTVLGPSARAYHQACEDDCRQADSLTEPQLGFINVYNECLELAGEVIKLTRVSETNPDGLDCDAYLRDCRVWCDPDSGSEGALGCSPALVPSNQQECESYCGDMGYAFHFCLASSGDEGTFCERLKYCIPAP